VHPIIQAALAKIHQDELLQEAQDDHLVAQARREMAQRPRWLPPAMHRTLALLRMRRHSRRLRLARRRYPTAWQHDLYNILNRD
jgi:hypothetical protein